VPDGLIVMFLVVSSFILVVIVARLLGMRFPSSSSRRFGENVTKEDKIQLPNSPGVIPDKYIGDGRYDVDENTKEF